MAETVFSKIINREIPADIIYEDDNVLVFLDINPTNKGHALVIPKKAFVNVFDIDPEILAHMMKIGKKVADVLTNTVGATGVNLIMNNGEHAGQEVFHAHLHVIPRFKGDQVFAPAKHTSYSNGESAALAMQLHAALAE